MVSSGALSAPGDVVETGEGAVIRGKTGEGECFAERLVSLRADTEKEEQVCFLVEKTFPAKVKT
jgi:hypothetical protein